MSGSSPELVEAALAGDRRALSQLLTTLVEQPSGELAKQLTARPRSAQVVGITGPPGVGKSTLVDRLLVHLRARGASPAVVAVDPSSPFSGGALLGDRIRMQQHASDQGIFIRSLATRGELGGLTAGAAPVVAALAAAGFDPVLVETVGVGQSELEVVKVADTVVVVLHPGWGDDIQLAKTGLLEIADVFCVNKADQGDAASTASRLQRLGETDHDERWIPPVVVTIATDGEGIDALWEAVEEHGRRNQAVETAPDSSA
ncbi:MAG TPA: methylmalonyl Co-A mutase-associated GTPase MeaB [Acidimicrobiia bacterium]|nr:methylmalonyl Co-A mutase-associated GTPase MeaB [Acidimicrobiia bacterium]